MHPQTLHSYFKSNVHPVSLQRCQNVRCDLEGMYISAEKEGMAITDPSLMLLEVVSTVVSM